MPCFAYSELYRYIDIDLTLEYPLCSQAIKTMLLLNQKKEKKKKLQWLTNGEKIASIIIFSVREKGLMAW
jgi:hypothetical protein